MGYPPFADKTILGKCFFEVKMIDPEGLLAYLQHW